MSFTDLFQTLPKKKRNSGRYKQNHKWQTKTNHKEALKKFPKI